MDVEEGDRTLGGLLPTLDTSDILEASHALDGCLINCWFETGHVAFSAVQVSFRSFYVDKGGRSSCSTDTFALDLPHAYGLDGKGRETSCNCLIVVA